MLIIWRQNTRASMPKPIDQIAREQHVGDMCRMKVFFVLVEKGFARQSGRPFQF